MTAHDANEATWFVVRYEEDFLAPDPFAGDPSAPFAADSYPWLADTLFYDRARHVLELLPKPVDPRRAVRPPPGLAVDVDGTIYRVDPRTGELRIVFCDGSDARFPCEPQVLARPAGIAIDARDFILVADPAARRVVALSRTGGGNGAMVELVLAGGMIEPVDVAVGFDGRYYVADRAAGRIEIFDRRSNHVGGFVVRNAEHLPALPAPIAVMIDGDGTLLVADATHPRLLRFTTAGEPLDDAQLSALVASLAGGDVALDALARAYGTRAPRFLGVGCCPLDANAAIVRLAGVHRAIRLLTLVLDREYETTGTFVSRRLDSGVPGTTWHKITIEATLPAKTSVVIETATSDDPMPLSLVWSVPETKEGASIAFVGAAPPIRLPGGALTGPADPVCDQLVQSTPGRFLWLRVTLQGDSTATPSLAVVRASYPRVSYAELLPAVYRRDPDAGRFTEQFLALFEREFTGVEDRYVEFIKELDPQAAPLEMIDWLAALIDLAFDPSWSLAKRRALVGEAMELYALRGTPRGIERYVEIYTGKKPLVIEAFLERPHRPPLLGRPGAMLGCGLPLIECAPRQTPDATLYAAYAHRFRVYVYLDDPCDETVVVPVVNRIVEVNKPAHTIHEICLVYPGAEVGISTSVGIGLVLGAPAAPPPIQLANGPASTASVLGEDTILK